MTSAVEETTVSIEPMRKRHLRAVVRTERAVYDRGWSLGMFVSELAAKNRCYVVATQGSTVVGHAGLIAQAGDGHITTIAVSPDWQRRKVGTRLLLALARGGLALGCSALTLEVRASNRAAQAMYVGFGFAPAGIRRGYYTHPNEDAIVMWARDVDGSDFDARLARIEEALPGETVWPDTP